MASSVDWKPLQGYKHEPFVTEPNNGNNTPYSNDSFPITIEATCPTGFEMSLDSEIKEKFPGSVTVKHQGRVFFDVSVLQIEKVLTLRCMDNAWVLIGVRSNFDFSGDVDACMSRINGLLNDTDCDNTVSPLAWEKGLIAWNKLFKFKTIESGNWHNCMSLLTLSDKSRIEVPNDKQVEKKLKIEDERQHDTAHTNVQTVPLPTFRATCYRSGEKCHPFGSPDVARHFGGLINDKFGWGVSLKNFDIEVVITIDVNQVYVGIGLTKQSLFKRNIEHFGPTTLRATICASLLTLANIKPGEIVVDPMCGGASIPIEGTLAFSNAFHIGGDYHDKAIERSSGNFKYLCESLTKASKSHICNQLPGDILQWDVTNIPLRDNSVDVFVTDLPFGKRSGSKADNRILYPKIMNSMARVVKPKLGRAVLLTQDKTSMFKAQGKFNKFWKINRQHYCNIGGLSALVFIMTRTEAIP